MKKCIKDTLFFEGPESLKKPLTPKDIYLGSDISARIFPERVVIYYLNSSDEIYIPKEYLNLFQLLNTREGDHIRSSEDWGDLWMFLSLGMYLPGMILHGTDPKGMRSIISRLVLLGTSWLREVLPDLPPWTLRNVNNTIEI